MLAQVESRLGDVLSVRYDDGSLGGSFVLSFLTALSLYCLKSDFEGMSWLSLLDKSIGGKLCTVVQPLINSFYSGKEWGYFAEDEFVFFQHRYLGLSITEEEYKIVIQELSLKWTSINDIAVSIENLLKLMEPSQLENNWWYVSLNTISDFQALLNTIAYFREIGTDEVRILFV